jgi:hypothetical protein
MMLDHARQPIAAIGRFALLTLLLLVLMPLDAAASTLTAGPDDYRQQLRKLAPGDRLVLQAGQYRRGLPVHGINGTVDAPIVIEGPVDGPRAVLLGRPGHNIVSIKNSSHVVIRNLEIDGQGEFVDAVKAEGTAQFAHHITLENLLIHNLVGHQQSVGISSKCLAWGWVVRGNRIVGAGTGMYFGDSDGSAPFIGGIIEGNQVINTIGYNLQIKHQKARPKISVLPQGPQQTVIRDNLFIKAEGSSQGPAARPNLLVGHFPITGPGSDDRYVIHGNLFFQNANEALFQGEGNIDLYANLFYRSEEQADVPAVAIQPHNDIPRRVRVAFNTIVSPGAGIRVLRKEDDWVDDQWLIGNAVFARTPLRGGRQSGNLVLPYAEAVEYLRAPIDDLDRLDLSPGSDGLSGEPVDLDLLGESSEGWRTIDDKPIDANCRGAYACR